MTNTQLMAQVRALEEAGHTIIQMATKENRAVIVVADAPDLDAYAAPVVRTYINVVLVEAGRPQRGIVMEFKHALTPDISLHWLRFFPDALPVAAVQGGRYAYH